MFFFISSARILALSYQNMGGHDTHRILVPISTPYLPRCKSKRLAPKFVFPKPVV